MKGKRRHSDFRREVFKRESDAVTYPQRRVGAVDESTNESKFVLNIKFDIHKDERDVSIESGQKRLPNDYPRADGSIATDLLEPELRVAVVALRADDVGWMAELLTTRASRNGQIMLCRGRPIRCRLGVGHGEGSRSRHGITLASWSAMISSQV